MKSIKLSEIKFSFESYPSSLFFNYVYVYINNDDLFYLYAKGNQLPRGNKFILYFDSFSNKVL